MGRLRKRVEAEADVVEVDTHEMDDDVAPNGGLKRAKDGSAFTKCIECNKDVPVALISFHSCSLDAKIKMNLDSLVVVAPESKKKPSERKKPKLGEPKAKKEKKEKDPNAPKRPQTAFFVFMETFRKEFTAANPDSKKGSTVAKEGGIKWQSMTEEEKKPYVDKAAELKAVYGKAAVAPEDADAAGAPEDAEDHDEEAKLDKIDEETAEVDEAGEPSREEKESTEVDEIGKADVSTEESIEVDEDGKPDKEEKESAEVEE